MTIAATAITIDGATAWWVIDLETAWRRKHDNRPCDTCSRRQAQTGAPTGMDCTDCHGTGRHTLTIDLECEWCVGYGYLLGAPDHYEAGSDAVIPCTDDDGEECNDGSRSISVHVVEMLEIRDGSKPCDDGTAHIRDDGPQYLSANRYVSMPARGMGEYVTLSEDAAPGKYVVRLAVDT
jgi:hypothetical protein